MTGEGRRRTRRRQGALATATGVVTGVVTTMTLLAAVSGCSETKAKVAPPPPTVVVAPVARRDVALYLEAVGGLDGYVNAEIRARVRGILLAQRYKDGATVKQGQLLFTIDRAEYQAALDSARAALARAQTGAAHNKAQLERRKDLTASAVVSKQELEDAEAAAHDSEDQVRAASAQVRQAELNLSYTEIHSPVTGVAGLAQVRVGNLVGQDGPTLLTTVSQVDPIRVNFPMSESDYVRSSDRLKQLDGRDLKWAQAQFAKMARGEAGDDSIELLLSDGSVYKHRGVIVAVNRQVDTSTGTIQLQALFPNPGNFLRPGQFGRVRMPRRDVGANALVVPENALLQVQGTYSLAVVGADNKVSLHRVEVGPTAGTARIINSGVQAGDRVVVDGLQKVSDGLTVVAVAAPATAPAPAPATTTATASPPGGPPSPPTERR
ncbi:MAG TPA: efflux RND transporter periplasmic adaptor subunit [Polyangia bacterium]|nr:efflux RND transporter periplasmic adaptor subunit [Polyangia bacterium]